MNATIAMPSRHTNSPRAVGLDLRPKMIAPLTQVLRQLALVIESLSDAHYGQKPVGVIESSIGGHVRHCLDHVQSLLAAVETGCLDYDHRQRGTPVESSRRFALDVIDSLTQTLEKLSREVITWPVSVSISMSSNEAPVSVLSSFGRELAYVLTHTIHHNAIVNAMVKTLGGWVPDKFGYAPSTIKHLEQKQCAQ